MNKYFLYSRDQASFKKSQEEKLGRKFKMGFIIISGAKKSVTEINSTGESRFADAKVVATIDSSDSSVKYSQPGYY